MGMDVERDGFAAGDIFKCGGRIFHSGWDSCKMVEFCSDGRMPPIGKFENRKECEAAVREIVETGRQYDGDFRPQVSSKIKQLDTMQGLHWYICRRRVFRLINDHRFSSDDKDGIYAWSLVEEHPNGPSTPIGDFAKLSEAKNAILTACQIPPRYKEAVKVNRRQQNPRIGTKKNPGGCLLTFLVLLTTMGICFSERIMEELRR